MGSFPIRQRLPTRYNTEIGRVITRFAIFESRLRRLLYALLELEPKLGRIAVRDPRIDSAFAMIQDILVVRGFSTSIDLNAFRKECIKIEAFRDKLAHAVWVRHPGTKVPVLQDIAGKYALSPGGPSVKARIHPKALGIRIEDFKVFLVGIRICIKVIQGLGREIDRQRRAWRKKSQKQQSRAHSRKAPRASRMRKARQLPPPP